MTRGRRTIPLMGEPTAAARDCPLAPPEHASVQSRALHRACLIVGGVDLLAQRLSVSVEALACVEIILLYASGRGHPS
jgi:hypothetical protein